MRHLLVAFCLVLATFLPARASAPEIEVAGVRLPERLNVAGRTLLLNGAGLRKVLFMDIYVAALYLPERHQDTQQIINRDIPRTLQLTLLRDLSTQQNLDALKDGLHENSSPGEIEAIRTDVDTFLGYIKSLREVSTGTVIQMNYLPGEGTRVSVNGRYMGTVGGPGFNRAMLKIWLGEHPAQSSLKRALLGAV